VACDDEVGVGQGSEACDGVRATDEGTEDEA